MEYVNKKEAYFRNVDEETYYVIGEFLHSKKMLNQVVKESGEERVDMCKALEDLYNDGVEAGRAEGIEKEKIVIAKNLLDVLDVETIAEKVGLPLEKILQLKESR